MNVVAELDESLNLNVKYVYANGMLVGSINTDDDLLQYFHDGLGSITMICDSSGSYQNLYVYDDFGNFKMMEESGSVTNHYYYTGQERDENPSGLYNLRARYYAAGIGRFTQEDPLMNLSVQIDALLGTDPVGMLHFGVAQPQRLHGYAYVRNNPVNWIDPMGLGRQGWCGKLKGLDRYWLEQLRGFLKKREDLNYGDINITGGEFVGATGGLIVTRNAVYPYFGFGLVGTERGVSGSLTFSADEVSPGWNVGVQGSGGISAQLGIHSYTYTGWCELGAGLPSISLTAFYVFPPIVRY
jgi:RHS repeat-associated protein